MKYLKNKMIIIYVLYVRFLIIYTRKKLDFYHKHLVS